MVTWSIDGLVWNDELKDYPKKVVAIRVTGINTAGLQLTYQFEIPSPGEGETFIPFDELTESWAWEMSNLYNDTAAAEAYLAGETGTLTYGDSLPWMSSE